MKRRLAQPAAACFLFAAVLGAMPPEEVADTPLPEEIQALLAAGREEEAVAAVVERVRADPGREAVWMLASRVFDSAIAAGATAGLMNPAVALTEEQGRYAGPWILLGRVYLAQANEIERTTGFAGSFRRTLLFCACDAFRAALDRNPKSVEAGSHLAFALLSAGDEAGARDEIQRVLVQAPEDAYALYLLGEIELMRGEPSAAQQLFQRALKREPALVEAAEGEVKALVALGRREEAAEIVTALFAVHPERAGLGELARAIYEPIERYLDAMALYRGILQSAPDRSDVLYLLGRAEVWTENIEAAKRHMETVLRLEPEHLGARYAMGLIGEKLRRYDEAAKHYLQLLEAPEPSFIDAAIERLKVLAYLDASNGRYSEAIAVYDRLMPILPFDTELAANRALVLSQSGSEAAADEAYAQVLELEPDDGQILNDYALHLMGTGRTASALDFLHRAWSEQGDIDACENMGAYYYYDRSDFDCAAEYLGRVLEVDPLREKSLILLQAIRRLGRGG